VFCYLCLILFVTWVERLPKKKMINADTHSTKGSGVLPPLTEVVPDEPYGKTLGSSHRSIEVLELFAVEKRPLTVSDVSEKLAYPQSSTSVLLHGLSDLGYLHHDRYARTFFPTLRVSFLGMWLHPLDQGNLLDFMETLARESGHVAMLAMRNGIHAQYIHIISERPSRVGLKPGLLRPICRSAVGKVLLSTMGDDEIAQIVRNVNAVEVDFASPIDMNSLIVELQDCRKTGFAFSIDSVTPGSSVIAARIPGYVGSATLAIGVAVHTSELREARAAVMALIGKTLASYFPAEGQAKPKSRPTKVPQGGYLVSKKNSV